MNIFNYDGGNVVPEMEINGQKYIRVYNNTGSAISKGAIKCLVRMYISGVGIVMVPIAPATNATESNRIGIFEGTLDNKTSLANADYGWFLVKGVYGDTVAGAATTGTITANDQLEILNGGTAFQRAGSGNDGGGVELAETCAMAISLVTTNQWIIYLTGALCQVKGS